MSCGYSLFLYQFLILYMLSAYNFIKNGTPALVFSFEFCKISKNSFFLKLLQVTLLFNVTKQDYLKENDVLVQLLSYLHAIGENFVLKVWGIWYYSLYIGENVPEIWYCWYYILYTEEIFWKQELLVTRNWQTMQIFSYNRQSVFGGFQIALWHCQKCWKVNGSFVSLLCNKC